MRAVLLALFTTLMAIHTFAQPNKDGIDGIYYNLNISSLTAEVTFCHFYASDPEDSYMYDGPNFNYAYSQYKYQGELTIPESVTYEGKTYKVTALGDNALYGCDGLTKLNLPKTFTTFGKNWTHGCTTLQSVTVDASNPTYRVINNIVLKGNNIQYIPLGVRGTVTIPDCVTAIPTSAFDNHKYVQKIVLHNNITSIEGGAFNECSSLEEINIPTSISTIEEHTFYNCSDLKSISIPSNVKTIGTHAFTGSGLETVTLNEGLTSINNYAFYNIQTLTNINLPNSLTTIGNNALDGCSGIKSLHFGKTLKNIGENALRGCNAETYSVHPDNTLFSIVSGIVYNKTKTEILYIPKVFPDEITIPGTINTLPERLFEWNTNITTVTIEEGFKSIPDYLFLACENLTTVNIPASVDDISLVAFDFCYNLETVNIDKANTTYSSYGPLILSDNGSFLELCLQSAVDVVVPETVTELPGDVFIVCDKIRSVTFLSSTPPIIDSFYDGLTFGDITQCQVFVPEGSESDYASSYSLDPTIINTGQIPTGITTITHIADKHKSRLTFHNGRIIISKEGDKYSLYGTKIM